MIHLRLRTEYSFGQTFAPIGALIAHLKTMGVTAAGIVDGSTWGHVEWFTKCTAAGIQPLLGAECVVSDDDRQTRMWFLASTTQALSELYQALSHSYQQPLKTKFGSLNRLYRSDVLGMSPAILKFAGDSVDGPFLHEVKAYADLNPSSVIRNATLEGLGLPVVTSSSLGNTA